jgi:hypothetical protein
MKHEGLWYIGGIILLLIVFKDFFQNIMGISIPDITENIGGFFGNIAEYLDRNPFDDATINAFIHDGKTAEVVYRWYQLGFISYVAGYRYLQNTYAEIIGNVNYPTAGTWAAGQLEKYAGYGN